MNEPHFRLATISSAQGLSLVTEERIRKGALIFEIRDYQETDRPSYRSVQVGPHRHIEDLGLLAYLNHSCRPNVIVDTTAMTVRACREISAGAELTFFYPSTEWKMDRPFVCLCGAPECIRLVAGACYLSLDVLGRYFVNEHIRMMALERLRPVRKRARSPQRL